MTDEAHATNTLGTLLNGYGLWTWAWVMILSLSGGVANFARKLREGAARPFNFAEFVGEIFISAFAGICTFLLCEAAAFNQLLSAALIAISGHMGSRAVFLFERLFARKFGAQSEDEQELGIGAATESPTEPRA